MSKKKKITKLDGWVRGYENHKLEMKDFTIKRSHCAEPSCKFFGHLAEQGVCHTIIPDAQSRYYGELMKNAEEVLAFNRKHNYKKLTQRQLIKHLESEVVCYFMNYSNCLDELIWLRGENAKLRGKLGMFSKS